MAKKLGDLPTYIYIVLLYNPISGTKPKNQLRRHLWRPRTSNFPGRIRHGASQTSVMGVGSSNPRNVERRIPKEIQEKSTSPVLGKGDDQKIHRTFGKGGLAACPFWESGLASARSPGLILAKYELPKCAMECLECVAWPYEPWISGKGYQMISRFVVIEKARVKVECPHGQVRISHVANVQHLVFLEDNFNMNQESVAYRARELKDSSSKKQNTIQVSKVYKYRTHNPGWTVTIKPEGPSSGPFAWSRCHHRSGSPEWWLRFLRSGTWWPRSSKVWVQRETAFWSLSMNKKMRII